MTFKCAAKSITNRIGITFAPHTQKLFPWVRESSNKRRKQKWSHREFWYLLSWFWLLCFSQSVIGPLTSKRIKTQRSKMPQHHRVLDLPLRLVTQIALSNRRIKMWSLRKFLRKSILWFLIAGGVIGIAWLTNVRPRKVQAAATKNQNRQPRTKPTGPMDCCGSRWPVTDYRHWDPTRSPSRYLDII